MKLSNVFAWLATLMLLAVTCQAQPPRGGNLSGRGSGPDTLFRLLDMQAVRKELALRKLQIKMLGDLKADLNEQQRAIFFGSGPLENPGSGRGPRGGGQESRDRRSAMRAQVQKIRAEAEKLVVVVLDVKQSERLNQLRLQNEGARALDRRAVRDQLGVTEEQFKKIQALRLAENDPSASRRQQQQKLDKSVLALLNEEQQVKFKQLKGASFEFPLSVPLDLRGLGEPRDRSRQPSN